MEAKELDALTKSIAKVNEELSVLATLGGGPPEPEFNQWMETAVQELRVLLPQIRTIYEARKDQWFDRNNVLKHGHCHARTWHELVLNTAEDLTEGARLINVRNACRILHDSQYESGKVQIHLEREFEQAGKAILAASKAEPEEEHAPRIKASKLDRARVAFFDKLNSKKRTTQKEAAAEWAKIHKDECDEQGIRNAIYRVKNHGKVKGEHNKT